MDLQVKLPFLTLKNPILSASGTFGYGLEFNKYGDISELGGVIVKGLSLKPRPGNPMPRIAESACGMLNAIGLQNCGVEAFINKKLKYLPYNEVPIIANIYANSESDFSELADILAREEGIAAIEVNISCPNVHEGGILFGQDPVQAAKVTAAVKKKAGEKPVIVKLSPNVTDITVIARAVEDAGADIISCINTLSGMAVDLKTRKPRLANIIGGLSGPAIKPVALRCVWQVCKAVKIPVIAIGGIVTAEDVLEFIMVGASAVQIGTANFMRPDLIFGLPKQVKTLGESLGLSSLAELRNSLSV
ncbi:dihydroorotate dehydrogenase [Desulfovibrio litoralis]|uniref:Dihydroorotate dehydrogenase n=1 Tax=Desulfovibrio litoralis DSM 11393 TaxID=1121455 RepID=A0A1M7T4C5_9BACT|nr:dihydroorotate dehydrogenase [Desulfovibrio litoralis]SHN65541.1 dihydroorotate oxidase B, catalytic subunit [Desulfovibrio litoralis DSM 11393]